MRRCNLILSHSSDDLVLQSTAGNAQTADPLTAYNQAIQSRDWPGAVAAAQQLVSQSATSVNLNFLATAQLDSGAADQALATYAQALAAAKNVEQPADDVRRWEQVEGWSGTHLYLGEGNALLKLQRTAEALAAYNNAAQYSSKPATAYFNMCAVAYNNGDMENAAVACRKCLQADPAKADAWFVLASVLFAQTPVDAKGNMSFSAETKQALATSTSNLLRMAHTLPT